MARNACRQCKASWRTPGQDLPRTCPSCGGGLVYRVPVSFAPLVWLVVLGGGAFAAYHFRDRISLQQVREWIPNAPETAPQGEPPVNAGSAATGEETKDAEAARAVEEERARAEAAAKAAQEPPPEDAAAKAERERLEQEERRKAAEAEAKQKAVEKDATRALEMGRNFETNGKPLQAVEKYREVMEKYPGTAAAAEAKERERAIVERESGS